MPRLLAGCLVLVAACTRTATVGIVGNAAESASGIGSDEGTDGVETDGARLDLPGGAIDVCTERDGALMGIGICEQAAPPQTLQAMIQWEWPGRDGDTDTRVIPLVANVTDDDGDGDIDLCDTPDILVVAGPPPTGGPASRFPPDAYIYALDGKSGVQHWRSSVRVRAAITPALADIDDDGEIELVTLLSAGTPMASTYPSRLAAFEADGTMAWQSETVFDGPISGAVALADLDLDGDAEIMVYNRVFDHRGRPLFAATDVGETRGLPLMPLAVDLDGDDDLEVLWARGAYHHDGRVYWANPSVRQGFVHVANLDDDPASPEILVTTDAGLVLLASDGTALSEAIKPIDAPDSEETWRRPAAIHDIDGDGRPEVLLSVGVAFLTLSLNDSGSGLQIMFQSPVQDAGGNAAGTAFDFLGDGSADAMYADERQMFVFDTGSAQAAFTTPRSSVTFEEYPVVADVDNDGSAEIVVGSNATGRAADPTIRVIGDPNDSWVQARRIWNQHTYHVTNIGENGRLPTPERRHWQRTNTFRTNAQIEAGAVCLPEP